MNPALLNSIIVNPTKFRENLRKQFSLNYDLPVKDATNIEISVYNWALQESVSLKIVKKWENKNFTQIYIDRMRSIFINLKNPEFRNKVLSHEILPRQVGFLSHPEMCPERWQALMEQQMKLDENRGKIKVTASTELFTCRKCRSKRCTYYELQTRSSDEPTSIFVSCLECNSKWKQ